jgi:hypothetical protein
LDQLDLQEHLELILFVLNVLKIIQAEEQVQVEEQEREQALIPEEEQVQAEEQVLIPKEEQVVLVQEQVINTGE